MGTLIVMHYPTKLFLNAADHTYVRCEGTKAWGCWGGKTGGSELRRATGSTARADRIAEPDERAGITCYLINGVCHQAANRILLPANITVKGARGYSVSESLFGTYGRVRGLFGACNAPFNQYPEITGDLPQCVPSGTESMVLQQPARDEKEQVYLNKVQASYNKVETLKLMSQANDTIEFQMELFELKMEYHLGEDIDKTLTSNMLEIRRNTETTRIKIEEAYDNNEMDLNGFVDAFNMETKNFQMEMSHVLKPEHYLQFFQLEPGEIVELADPDIIAKMIHEPPPPTSLPGM